jgi:hypothetical protein
MKILSLLNQKKNFNVVPCSFERPLTFTEIAELSEQCEWARRKILSAKSVKPPLTFIVPAQQVIASISRFVE